LLNLKRKKCEKRLGALQCNERIQRITQKDEKEKMKNETIGEKWRAYRKKNPLYWQY